VPVSLVGLAQCYPGGLDVRLAGVVGLERQQVDRAVSQPDERLDLVDGALGDLGVDEHVVVQPVDDSCSGDDEALLAERDHAFAAQLDVADSNCAAR
jgi:hypothetical protein